MADLLMTVQEWRNKKQKKITFYDNFGKNFIYYVILYQIHTLGLKTPVQYNGYG